jgi:hypothetical protein
MTVFFFYKYLGALSLFVFEAHLSLSYDIFVLFAHHSYIKKYYEIPNATI